MEAFLYRLYKRKRLYLFLTVISHVCSVITAAAFLFTVGFSVFFGRYTDSLILFFSGAIGYILVTVLRNLIDAPRPYELYSFYEVKPKNKKGRSYPSRHIYCSFATAILAISVNPFFAIGLGLFALTMCFCRVTLGIHFIRDALSGALIGVIAGAVGIILI